eukprot:XP_764078.1 hypothetical protein [Theileria parva strain Muguga]
MPRSFEDVYNSVYINEDIWRSDHTTGIWNNKTFCLLGFNDSLESCKKLVIKILESLVTRGANVLKYPNKKLDVKRLSITYYLCNYSVGYESKPPNSLDYKLVTPIWLYSCNRDNKVYLNETPPFFRANRSFNCLKFKRTGLKVSLFGSFKNKPDSSTEDTLNYIRYSFDTLVRFISHCGFTFLEPSNLKKENCKKDNKLYLLFCKTFDESIDDHVVNLSTSIPCLSIEWLFDSYLSGELREIKNYLVTPQKFSKFSPLNNYSDAKPAPKKRKNVRGGYGNKVLCFSYGFAVENELNKTDFKDFGSVAAYVVNPIYVLAPWSLDTKDNDLKKMYNSISLVEDNKLLLFVSRSESSHEGMGIFGELSMLVENCAPKLGKNLVRHVKIYNSFDTTDEHFFDIPSELLAGNKLQIFERSGNVNLYDLAESITFVDIDNLSQYQDEIGSETTQELHDM